MNTIKRRKATPGAALTRVTFEDFEALQEAADDAGLPHGRGTDLTRAQREVLKDIGPNGLGEGDFVQVVASSPTTPRILVRTPENLSTAI